MYNRVHIRIYSRILCHHPSKFIVLPILFMLLVIFLHIVRCKSKMKGKSNQTLDSNREQPLDHQKYCNSGISGQSFTCKKEADILMLLFFTILTLMIYLSLIMFYLNWRKHENLSCVFIVGILYQGETSKTI